MADRITGLDVQHNSTAVETDATADFDESTTLSFGDGDDPELLEGSIS